MMSSLLIEAHFLPSIEYFCALAPCEKVILEKHENYVKQTYRNRCYILTSQGMERLSVPLTAKHNKVPVAAVQIDYSYRWQTNFWRTLKSAYAKSPFFQHYADDLHNELFSGERFLFDFNQRLLSLCLKWLSSDLTISESAAYDEEASGGILDLRNAISVKNDFSKRSFYRPHAYQQVFGSKFVPNLSVVDLIFCTGPEARTIINLSKGR